MKKILGAVMAASLLFCQGAFADQPTTVLTNPRGGQRITIDTPFIDGANDEVFQQSANHVLSDAAEDVADKIGKQGRVTYEVTLNRPSLVSVLLKGSNGGNTWYRAVNIDLTSGREFSLDDFFFNDEAREKLLGKNADSVLFTEEGIALSDKKGAGYDRKVSYEELLPVARIGEIGRLLTVWRLTEKSDGKTLTVKQGDLFAFKLKANPSTGYQWIHTVTGGAENGLLKTGSSFMIQHTQQAQVGTPGTEFQFYAAKAPGEYKLSLDYQRPWEKGNAIYSCNVNVIVKE